MSSESLIKALSTLPSSEHYNFADVSFEENNDETDSLGSCCNSPNQSSEGPFSPVSHDSSSDDADSGYFMFPTKSNLESRIKLELCEDEDLENAIPTDTSIPDNKQIKRKLECKVKRNERERRRVRRLADGFRKLREVVPGNYKKLSKLDTLRRALEYMSSLADVLDTQSLGRYNQAFSGMAALIKNEEVQVHIYIFFFSKLLLCWVNLFFIS
jgi:Helix-loop-helix DNA-binding domain.